MAIKLAILVLKLIPIAIWGWRRLTLGPSANFSGLAGIQTQQVENTEGSAEIRESCSKFDWPIEAWVQFKLQRSRLFEMEMKKKRSIEERLRGQQKSIEWGSQIRSYVLDKQYVKDHRTGVMRFDPANVLDGDIQEFIWAGLEWMAGQRATATGGEEN